MKGSVVDGGAVAQAEGAEATTVVVATVAQATAADSTAAEMTAAGRQRRRRRSLRCKAGGQGVEGYKEATAVGGDIWAARTANAAPAARWEPAEETRKERLTGVT
jgi:hypothetical protein